MLDMFGLENRSPDFDWQQVSQKVIASAHPQATSIPRSQAYGAGFDVVNASSLVEKDD